MSYNPLEQEYQCRRLRLKKADLDCTDIQEKIQSVKGFVAVSQSSIVEEEQWHSSQDRSKLVSEEDNLVMELTRYTNKLRGARLAVQHAESKQAQLRNSLGSAFNPLNWFSASHKAEKKELRSWVESEKASRDSLKSLQVSIRGTEDAIKNIQAKIERYDQFEQTLCRLTGVLKEQERSLHSLTSDLTSAEQIRSKANSAVDVLTEKYREVSVALEPMTGQINQCYADIDGAKKKLDQAAKFEMELSSADSPRERKMIHTRCERQLGDGSPSKVRAHQNAVIEGLQRSLEKLHNRAQRVGYVASLNIKHVVIDGNNLMNEGELFIGLAAIDSLVSALSEFYRIDIFFDPGATRVLQMSRAALLQHFPKTVGVHITAGEADETLLNTSKSEESVVLSRDGYAEFPDKPVVSENRVFKPQLVGGKLFINELDLEISYYSDAASA